MGDAPAPAALCRKGKHELTYIGRGRSLLHATAAAACRCSLLLIRRRRTYEKYGTEGWSFSIFFRLIFFLLFSASSRGRAFGSLHDIFCHSTARWKSALGPARENGGERANISTYVLNFSTAPSLGDALFSCRTMHVTLGTYVERPTPRTHTAQSAAGRHEEYSA